jgi:heme-degrading monooxygenase HmoA
MFKDAGSHLVSVLLISVAPEDCEYLVRQATEMMKHKHDLDGFLEGEVFKSEDCRRILLITEWTSRHAWSDSQWDKDVAENLVSIVQTASAIDSRTYFRAGRITAGKKGGG